jgi:hypothetical protein
MTGPASTPHETFEQTGTPCACWLAGHREIRGVTVEECLHPAEYRDGAAARIEEALDV